MKGIVQLYLTAWRRLSKYSYPILFLFLANIIFTFIVTSPFTKYFRSKFQYSDALDAYEGYDFYGVMEFLNNYGQGLEPLNTLFIQFILAFFVFSVYSNSAILYAVLSKNKMVTLRPFWNGGLNYFWKILRLSFYYILAILLLLFIIWNVLLAVGINVLEVTDDLQLMRRFRIGIIIGIVFISLFSIIKQYTKIYIAIDKKRLISLAIYKSSKFLMRNVLKTSFLFFINFLMLAVVFVIYFFVRNALNVNSWVLLFILAQVLLLFKITARIIHLDSCYQLYEKITTLENE